MFNDFDNRRSAVRSLGFGEVIDFLRAAGDAVHEALEAAPLKDVPSDEFTASASTLRYPFWVAAQEEGKLLFSVCRT